MKPNLRSRTSFERRLPNDPYVAIEGGEPLGEYEHSEEPVAKLKLLIRQTPKIKEVAADEETPDFMPAQMSFSAAFSTARKRGLKYFSWRGKSYNTALA